MGDFANNLKFLREKNNFTRKEMADKLMVTNSAYTNYEAGYREPKFELLIKMASLLGASTDELLGCSGAQQLQPYDIAKDLLQKAGFKILSCRIDYSCLNPVEVVTIQSPKGKKITFIKKILVDELNEMLARAKAEWQEDDKKLSLNRRELLKDKVMNCIAFMIIWGTENEDSKNGADI